MDSTYEPFVPTATQFFSPSSSSPSIRRYRQQNPRQFQTQLIQTTPHTPSSSLDNFSHNHINADYANLNAHTTANANAISEQPGGLIFNYAGISYSLNNLPLIDQATSPRFSHLLPQIYPLNTEDAKCSLRPESESLRGPYGFAMSSSRGQRSKNKQNVASNSVTSQQNVGSEIHNIEIKTKFPVARIKRIMQADEEVGKVAQVTPVAVSKALELFMIALVSGAADQAREKGSKKVSAQHLKMVVESQPERFDFLAEIVGKVGNGPEGAGNETQKMRRKRKEESESMSEDEKEKDKVKRKVGARRKKCDE